MRLSILSVAYVVEDSFTSKMFKLLTPDVDNKGPPQ